MKYTIPTTEEITNARASMLAIKAKHDQAKQEVKAIMADMLLPSGRAKKGMRAVLLRADEVCEAYRKELCEQRSVLVRLVSDQSDVVISDHVINDVLMTFDNSKIDNAFFDFCGHAGFKEMLIHSYKHKACVTIKVCGVDVCFIARSDWRGLEILIGSNSEMYGLSGGRFSIHRERSYGTDFSARDAYRDVAYDIDNLSFDVPEELNNTMYDVVARTSSMPQDSIEVFRAFGIAQYYSTFLAEHIRATSKEMILEYATSHIAYL